MHSRSVLVWCLRVSYLKWEWFVDLPKLEVINYGYCTLAFKYDDSSELIMRSEGYEMKWFVDLPKLERFYTNIDARTFAFCNPRLITLESSSNHLILTSRCAQYWCDLSGWRSCFLKEENRSHQEFLFRLSLIPRRGLRSGTFLPVHCFFHTF